MVNLPKTKMLVLVGLLVFFGSWSSWAASDSIRPLKTILLDLEKHIAELTLNIERVSERIALLHEAPPTEDPIIQNLRQLDLKGWELHEEQWRLQLEHLKFAEKILKEFHSGSGDKAKLLIKWIDHERDYESALAAYRDKRHTIETKRLLKEGQMIERYLR